MERLHPVTNLILERYKAHYKPGQDYDGFKLGLVAEGGATRGVAPAATLATLLELGLKNTFDAVYGESIGNGVMAHFLTGQLSDSISTFWSLVNNKEYVNFRRFFSSGIVDNNFFRQQVEKHFPFNFPTFVESGVKFNLLAARVDSPNPKNPLISIDQFKDKNDFLEAIMASIHMPLFCDHHPYPYKDMLLCDAGVFDKLPIQKAQEDGCTHILVACASPIDYQPPIIPYPKRVVWQNLVRGYFILSNYPYSFAKHYISVYGNYEKTLSYLRAKKANKGGPPFIETIALPAGSQRLSTFETRKEVLVATAQMAEEETYKTFGLTV